MSDFIHEPDWPMSLDDAELEELDLFLRAHAGEDALLLPPARPTATSSLCRLARPSPDGFDVPLDQVPHRPMCLILGAITRPPGNYSPWADNFLSRHNDPSRPRHRKHVCVLMTSPWPGVSGTV